MSNSRHELFASEYLVTHQVGASEEGLRLDRFLKGRYSRRSREQIQKAIAEGAITVIRPHAQVGKLKPSTALLLNDEVQVLSERKPEPEVNFDYRVLYEDPNLFVIEKPSNLPVHPAGRYFFNTLLIHLKTQGFTRPLSADREFFLVHRIDKETSGILVLAKEREMCAALTRQFARRETEKRYLAVCNGVIERDDFTVDAAVDNDKRSRLGLKMAVTPESEGGYPALTRVRVLHRKERFTLVECFPKTGRQHQIRVHLDHVGHALVGDKIYGIPDDVSAKHFDRKTSEYFRKLRGLPALDAQELDFPTELRGRLHLPRHALHAAGLRFKHPLSEEWVQFTSDLPDDLAGFYWKQAGAGRESLRESAWGSNPGDQSFSYVSAAPSRRFSVSEAPSAEIE